MNKDEFQGGARYVGGKVEKTIGDTVSSRDWQVDGVVDQVAGGAQNLYGRAKSAVADAVDGAPELADKLGSDAREAADRAGQLARQGARTVQESAEDAPLLWHSAPPRSAMAWPGSSTASATDPMTAAPALKSLRDSADLRHLRQIIAGLDEGVILIDPDQSILWANAAALAMHGVDAVEDLGATVDAYRAKFQLRYRNNHRLGDDDYPIERVVSGEAFSQVVVEVAVAGEDSPRWVHQVRSLVLTDDQDEPECLVLVIQDVSAQFEAEEAHDIPRRCSCDNGKSGRENVAVCLGES